MQKMLFLIFLKSSVLLKVSSMLVTNLVTKCVGELLFLFGFETFQNRMWKFFIFDSSDFLDKFGLANVRLLTSGYCRSVKC